MNEKVLSINTLPEHLFHRLHSDKVRVREEKNGFITLMPIVDMEAEDREALWEEVKGLYGIVRSDIDEKTELAEAREEKYGRLG